MAATAEQVTAEPGLGSAGHTQWGWKPPSAAKPQVGLLKGAPPTGPCVCWAPERTKCPLEGTLHLGHSPSPPLR